MRRRGRYVPYYHNLDQPLLSLGAKDSWTIRSANQNLLILGGVGSGKTSASGKAFQTAFANAGMGGVVLSAKPDEAASWLKNMKKLGRDNDVIVLDASAKERFNILDYAAATIAADGFDQNLVELMRRFAEATNVASAADGGGNENSFFMDAALQWLGHCFPLLRVSCKHLTLRDVYRLITSAPKTAQQANTPEWQKDSFCWHVIYKADVLARNGNESAKRALDEHGDFWIDTYANLAERTRSSIEATLTNLIYPFMTGKLAELFSTDTTVVPEMAREGKIIILDLPVLKYGPVGAAAQSIFKYLFGLAVQREQIKKKTRPVFLWADECQFFLSKTDAELLSTARSSRTCCVFITQDQPTFCAQLGGNSGELAKSIIAKFGTKLFHSNNCTITNEEAAKLVGKTTKYQLTKNTARGLNSGGNLHQSEYSNNAGAGDGRNQTRGEGLTAYQDYILPPEYFSKDLRTGGPKNRKRADAIIVRSGGNFKATKSHWLKAEFVQ